MLKDPRPSLVVMCRSFMCGHALFGTMAVGPALHFAQAGPMMINHLSNTGKHWGPSTLIVKREIQGVQNKASLYDKEM